MDITKGTEQALDFLKQLYPRGMWVLTAIDPNKKSNITTATFTDVERCATWLEKFSGKRNIYFHVNQPREALSKKATKKDIGAAYFFHVDIDPRAGEDVDDEQARIDGLIDSWSYDLPRPHIVVFSGGGYQLFWRLSERFEIGGSVELAEDFERYNRTIEQVLDADNCHNVDRIMRVPGTMNIPDETKMKKGRKPAMARIVRIDEGTIPLDTVPPAPPKTEPVTASGRAVVVNKDLPRIDDLDELDAYGVSDKVKVVIAQGALPLEDCDAKQRGFSRSDWVFKVLCEFVRRGVPDDIAFSIVTDLAWPISEHVYAQKTPAEKYAIRQIERAHDFAVDPMLATLNERYAVIKNLGGKCRVVEEVADPLANRSMLAKITPTDFKAAWCNEKVKIAEKNDGSPVYQSAGRWWFEHKLRRQFDTLAFAPGKDVPGVYNLWQGFSVDPVEGDCSLFLAHIRDVICAGNAEHYEYVLGWLARCVQMPSKNGHTAIVLRGRQGTGKSFFVKVFGQLFGRHFLQISDAKHMVGNFNNHLRDCVVLFGDEAFWAGEKRHEGTLKTLVTEEMLQYEAKGVDAEQGRNFVHLIMATNNDWAIPADMDDRRFLMLDVSTNRQEDHEYFGALAAQLDAGGREALLHYLMNYDLGAFNVRAVPKTGALIEQQARSLKPHEEAFLQVLEIGCSPDPAYWRFGTTDGPDWVSVKGVQALMSKRAAEGNGMSTIIGLYLAKLSRVDEHGKPVTQMKKRTVEGEVFHRKMYRMRPLSELRERYAMLLDGGPMTWAEIAEDESIPQWTVDE